MNRSLCLGAALSVVAVACTDTTQRSDTTSVADTIVIAPNSTVPTGRPGTTGTAPESQAGAPDTATQSAGTSFTIAPDSYGPLRVGMTVAEAASAMGGGFGAPRGYAGGCGYAALTKPPAGLAVMLQDGRIARFEVRSGGITTAEGARIGDTEARIKSLYGSGVAATPHKYLQGGHYLTETPSAGSSNRIVFETDGSKVTEFRSGRVPEVEQVERCG